MKLFISYARVDKPLCKQVVQHLDAVHDVWYDKRLHAGMDWWAEIQERLAWCEGFVYLLSPESVVSEYCQKEHAIAIKTEKHIFPVLIQARTSIPKSLSHVHYADLSEGMEDILTLMNALTLAERRGRRTKAPVIKPLVDADKPPKDISPTIALSQAADAMEADNFDSAVFIIKQALTKKSSKRIARILQTLLTDAETSLEKQAYLREANREYTPIVELAQRSVTRVLGCEEFADFQEDFPDYDPQNVAEICAEINSVNSEISLSLMPKPFDWIKIPAGQVTLGKGVNDKVHGVGQTFKVDSFDMAKYPVTNAQFAKFIEAGGYNNDAWWTEAGLAQRNKESWTEPRYWSNSDFNSAEQPVVGVSWYEAIAFCLWMSEATGEKISLPTEQQWQYAAQGKEGYDYPWGNQWNRDLCNNNVDRKGIDKTSPVTQYEDKGDSPFGVVDMAGNVWEWCLTEYKTGLQMLNGTNVRVVRGGSWNDYLTDYFLCHFRYWGYPHGRVNVIGFRVARFN